MVNIRERRALQRPINYTRDHCAVRRMGAREDRCRPQKKRSLKKGEDHKWSADERFSAELCKCRLGKDTVEWERIDGKWSEGCRGAGPESSRERDRFSEGRAEPPQARKPKPITRHSTLQQQPGPQATVRPYRGHCCEPLLTTLLHRSHGNPVAPILPPAD